MKTEIVTVSFNVKLQYETDEVREYLIEGLKRDTRIHTTGWDAGMYSSKSIEGTTQILSQNET